MPRYSIIVPAYNVEAEIDACLASLVRPEIANCEIIVVNDGSTDETLRRIKAYEHDARLRVVDKLNGGLSDARNAGIEASTGDYLIFVDGDDWVESRLTRKLDETLAKHSNADLIVFGLNEIRGGVVSVSYPEADFWRITNSACNKLFARHLFDEHRFDLNIGYEDLALIPAIFLSAKKAVTLKAALYNYRRDRLASFMNENSVGAGDQLIDAASRCIRRIYQLESSGHVSDLNEVIGSEWQARFETVEIFIPCVLHAPINISSWRARIDHINKMLALLPSRERICVSEVRRRYGLKMAIGSLLYRLNRVRAGHFLLHGTGEIKSQFMKAANLIRTSIR